MKSHGVRYESPEAAAMTLFGLLPEPEVVEVAVLEPHEAWLAALERRAGKAAVVKARKLRAAKALPLAA